MALETPRITESWLETCCEATLLLILTEHQKAIAKDEIIEYGKGYEYIDKLRTKTPRYPGKQSENQHEI